MRKEFLRSVAERFLSETDGDLRGCTFVFPNRRSALFFRRYLGESVSRAVFSPRLTNINDLFTALSGLRTLDRSLFCTACIRCSWRGWRDSRRAWMISSIGER